MRIDFSIPASASSSVLHFPPAPVELLADSRKGRACTTVYLYDSVRTRTHTCASIFPSHDLTCTCRLSEDTMQLMSSLDITLPSLLWTLREAPSRPPSPRPKSHHVVAHRHPFPYRSPCSHQVAHLHPVVIVGVKSWHSSCHTQDGQNGRPSQKPSRSGASTPISRPQPLLPPSSAPASRCDCRRID